MCSDDNEDWANSFPLAEAISSEPGIIENRTPNDARPSTSVNGGKKPSRPCVYCGVFQTKLTRHIKTVHKNEEKVKEILGLDRKQQEKEFDLLRKQGIYEHNLKLMKKGKTQQVLEVERKQIKKEGKESKLKVCTLCKAFVKSTYYAQHVKACSVFKDESQSKNQIVSCLSADLLQKYEDTKDKEFVDILNRFATDEVGTFCKNDKMLLTFGAFMFKKNRRRKGKGVESRRVIMQNMRTLATLFLKFKEFATAQYKEVQMNDMYIRTNFSFLEEAIDELAMDEKGNLKSGAKLFLGNVLKRSIKVFQGFHLFNNDDKAAEEIDKFGEVLRVRWAALFADAESDVIRSRQETLRRPAELPLENDVAKVRRYTISEI